MARKAKQRSGGARLKASGRIPSVVGMTAAQAEFLRAAAAKDDRPLTQILLRGGIALAEKILEKSFNVT
jgi:type II secretory pathway component PulK